MDFKKEVKKLLEMDCYSENEKEVVTDFTRTILRDNNQNNIKIAYNSYYSFRRNSPIYNKDASNIIEKIYNYKIKF